MVLGRNITGSGKFTSCDEENNYNFIGLFRITGPNSIVKYITCEQCVFGNMQAYQRNESLLNNLVGFVGYNMGELSYDSVSNGSLFGNLYVGGFAGFNAGSVNISVSKNNNFYINDYAEGITGYNTGSIDENCIGENISFLKYSGTHIDNIYGYDATK